MQACKRGAAGLSEGERGVNRRKEAAQSLREEGESRTSDNWPSNLDAVRSKVTLLSFMTALILICYDSLQLRDPPGMCVISPCLASLVVSSCSSSVLPASSASLWAAERE